MGRKPLDDSKRPVTTRIAPHHYEALQAICDKTGATMPAIIRAAIHMYLSTHGEEAYVDKD